MTCDREKVIALSQGDLAFGEAAEIRAHLRSCDWCARYMESVKRLEDCLRERMNVLEDIPSIADSVMARLPSPRQAERAPRRWKIPALRLAIAAVVVWLLLAVWLLQPAPTPDRAAPPHRLTSSGPAPKPHRPSPDPYHQPERRTPDLSHVVERRVPSQEREPRVFAAWEIRSAATLWEISSAANPAVETREVATVADAHGNRDVVVADVPPADAAAPPDLRDRTARDEQEPRPADDRPIPRYPDSSGRHLRPGEDML